MNNIKNITIAILASITIIGCSGGMNDGCGGWSEKEISGTGQVKRVGLQNNIVCPNYYEADISLGIMRNGVGSVSTHDMVFFIPDSMLKDFRTYSEKGSIVNFTYDVRRFDWCVNEFRLTSVKLAE